MQIWVDGWIGKKIIIDCEPSDTIYDIALKYQDKTGIPPLPCKCYFIGPNSKHLVYDKTLADQYIQNEDTLRLCGRICSRRCDVIYDNQNKITLDEDCPICLKGEIEKIFGIKPECQELIVDGEIINTDNHIDYCRLDEVTLKLKLPKDYKK